MKQKYNITNRHGLTMNTISHTVDAPRGTVIIHHGYPGAAHSPTAEIFNKLGLNTVSPNTTYNYNKSDGDYRDATLRGHCDDLIDCVIRTVDLENFVGPLVIAGHSAGGYSAIVASSELEGKYQPVLTIASAPLISGNRYLEGWKRVVSSHNIPPEEFMEKWQLDGSIPCQSSSGPDTLELRWSVMLDWCKHDLIENKIAPTNPTFLIGGEADSFIAPEDILAYASVVEIGNVHIIPNADHSYTNQEHLLEAHIESVVSANFPKP